GSHVAKWHIPSFHEPNDWDLVATASQSILFIDKIMTNAMFKDIKLIYYLGTGLKIIGKCAESRAGENSIKFEVEVISDKVDLRKMRLNESVNNKNKNVKDSMDIDDKAHSDEDGDSPYKESDNSDEESDEKSDSFDEESAQMILEICYDV